MSLVGRLSDERRRFAAGAGACAGGDRGRVLPVFCPGGESIIMSSMGAGRLGGGGVAVARALSEWRGRAREGGDEDGSARTGARAG